MPEQRIDAYSWQLSGGLRQRAMIAMALSCKPRLLIADEPTTAIDVTTQAQVLALLRDLQARYNTAIIFITHDLGVIAQMASYVVVMYLGRVMEEGPVDDIFHAPKHPYTRALLRSIPSLYGQTRVALPVISGALPHPFNRPPGCPFHPRCPDVMPRCSAAVPRLMPVGDQPARELLPAPRRGGAAMSARRDRQPLPDRCSTSAACRSSSRSRAASCSAPWAMSAPSTASTSPSTRARRWAWWARAAAARPRRRAASCAPSTRPAARSSTARATGKVVDLASLPPAELLPLRAEIQMIFQDPFGSLNPRMTLLDNVGEPLLVNGMKNRRERADRVAELLRLVGLRPGFMHRFPHAFSGGQRQRIGIARALATNPRLVVADEPVSALDVSIQAQVLNLLLELQARLKLTFLFVAHDLSVVRHISDRIAVMYVGQLVELAPTDAIFRQPQHPYTAALMRAVPVADPRVQHRRRHPGRRGAEPGRAAVRLLLPSALPPRPGALPGRGAGAARDRARPFQPLPFRGRDGVLTEQSTENHSVGSSTVSVCPRQH